MPQHRSVCHGQISLSRKLLSFFSQIFSFSHQPYQVPFLCIYFFLLEKSLYNITRYHKAVKGEHLGIVMKVPRM